MPEAITHENAIIAKYYEQIADRSKQGLAAKPIEESDLLAAMIEHIKAKGVNAALYLEHVIYNTVPGGTASANEKADFLKEIALGNIEVQGINADFALTLLEHMKGGRATDVLIDLLEDQNIGAKAAKALSNMYFLYDDHFERLQKLHDAGNSNADELLTSYAKGEFFSRRPEVPEEIEVVVFKAAKGDISTDLLSPGKQSGNRADRELHATFMISPEAQKKIKELQKLHPNKQIMIVSENGTFGVGSSRMSGVNNVALLTGKPVSPYIPFVGYAPIVAGSDGVAPIFQTTLDVTGGLGLKLPVEDLHDGGVLRINLKDKKVYVDGVAAIPAIGNAIFRAVEAEKKVIAQQAADEAKASEERVKALSVTLAEEMQRLAGLVMEGKADEAHAAIADISKNLGAQTMDNLRAGSSYMIAFGRKLQDRAAQIVGIDRTEVFAPLKRVFIEGQGQTAAEKLMSAHQAGHPDGTLFHAGSALRVRVDYTISQDTTGPLTQQELESMAATKLAAGVRAAFQSMCHTAAVRDDKTVANNKKLAAFMHKFGVVTGRSPNDSYPEMTDVVHTVGTRMVVDDWALGEGGDSHSRWARGLAFGVDSGTLALAMATGESVMKIPESVKVTFAGEVPEGTDFRDIVSAVQRQMLEQTKGENVYQSRIIEVHLGGVPADVAFALTDWTAEMKAKAAINIMTDEALITSLEVSIGELQQMVDAGMDNNDQLVRDIEFARNRIKQIQTGEKPALRPDADAKYASEIVVDLGKVKPYIVDPAVDAADESKRYTHDVINELDYYEGKKPVHLGFIGSCMINIGDIKTVANILRTMEARGEKIEFKTPLVIAVPAQGMIEQLKESGDWAMLQKYAVYEFDRNNPRTSPRTDYKEGPGIYLEVPGCNLCMGNQEKGVPGSTILTTSTRLFQGRVVEDLPGKPGASLIASAPSVLIASMLNRIPAHAEYTKMMEGVKMPEYKPSTTPLVYGGKAEAIPAVDPALATAKAS